MSGSTRQRSGTDIGELVERAVAYDPDADPALLRRAYELAEEAHRGQKRLSGHDYVTHPLEVAKILAELEMDDATLAAALLHDVVEDTGRELDEVREKFGEEIASLVDGVTKLRRIQFDSTRERQAENLRRMLLAMAKDLRVILIKLADRLHNMRTLAPLPAEQRMEVAQETLQILAPIAHRLGVWRLKWELEDLALRHVERKKYGEPRGPGGHDPAGDRAASRAAGQDGAEGGDRGPPQALLQHLPEDAEAGGGLRPDPRPGSDPGDSEYGDGVLHGAGGGALAVAASAGYVHGLCGEAEVEQVSVAPY